MTKFRTLLITTFAVFAIAVPTALAAHNGNNAAQLTGTAAEPDATGKAIVNYSEGRGDFNGTITVRNLVPGATYRFFVRRGGTGMETLVCSGEANSQGTFICQEQHLLLPGFTMAVVRDSNNTEVAIGTFDRRGNCRDPEQGGSLCKAPGQNR